MTSTFSLFALFCLLLCAQASGKGTLTKLKTITRDGNRLTVTFDSVGDITASWHAYVSGADPKPDTFQTVSGGIATYELNDAIIKSTFFRYFALRLGSIPDHYASVMINLRDTHEGVHKANLDFTMARVTPGTNLEYTPGVTQDVSVTVERPGSDIDFYANGVFFNDGNMYSRDVQAMPNVELTYPIGSTAKLNFMRLDSEPINRYFQAEVYASSNSSLVSQITEQFMFSVHEQGKTLPQLTRLF